MKRYVATFKFAAMIISLPCGFLLAVNLFHMDAIGILLSGGFLFLFWVCFWLLRKRVRYAFAGSFLVAVVVWLPFLYQTIRRIKFVLANGGMERSDGQGSPLAFLFGLVMEQALFIPLTAVVLVAIIHLLRPNKTLNSDALNDGASGS